MLTFGFRLPPGPRAVDYAVLAEELGYGSVWCPEVPAFGHDIWVALARIADRTSHIGIGAAVLIPSYRHPLAQASGIATVESIAPGRLSAGFGTGFTGRTGMGQPPLKMADMETHMEQVRALLRGDAVAIDGGMTQFLASDGFLPEHPINVPMLLAAQGPKGRQLAHKVADGLISLGAPASGFETSLVSVNGTVMDDDEDVTSLRVKAATAPLVALAYHSRYMADPESVRSLPNGEEWLTSVEQIPEELRHLSVHRGHSFDVSNGHDELVDTTLAKKVSFTGTRDELRARLAGFEDSGATGVIVGTSGTDVEREMRAYAEVAGL